jgi:hypothetical protein
MTKNLEDAELIAFFDWVAWQSKRNPILQVIHHVENERKCSIAQGNRRKRKGVKAGIPDIVCPIPSGDFHGLYIEMKTKKGKISPEQERMMRLLHGLGHCVRVAYSGKEAISILEAYLKAPRIH